MTEISVAVINCRTFEIAIILVVFADGDSIEVIMVTHVAKCRTPYLML